MKRIKDSWTLSIGLLLVALYVAIAWGVFQYRNPLSNEMSFYRNFGAVMRFEKVPGYQMPQ